MLKNLFEELTFIQKMQLYFLVPMLLWLLLFLFEKDLINKGQNAKIQNQNKPIDIPTNKIKKISSRQAIQFIEQKAKYYKVKTLLTQRKQNMIIFEFLGTYTNLLSFVQKLKLHFEISNFQLTQELKFTKLDVTLNNEYLFNTDSIKKEFIIEKSNINSKSVAVNVKLEAIVNDEVLIDGLWYKKGDRYKGRKIMDIKNRFIKFQDMNLKKIIKVELDNEPL